MRSTFLFLFAFLVVLLVLEDSTEAQGNKRGKYSTDLQIGITKKIPKEQCKRKSRKGDMVYIHYTGYLQDGTVFDSSIGKDSPFRFTLGRGQVIAGWDKGILGMCLGEKRKLTIPPHLGYGDKSVGTIPAGATLIFDAELVSIAGYTPDIEIAPSSSVEAPAATEEAPIEIPETVSVATAATTSEEVATTPEPEPEEADEQFVSVLPVDLDVHPETGEAVKDEL
ncbi:hypothetical protein V1520DRAFT_85703 [Lipomyces starkeyi]|uniref:peptidylprolyl isomerase n=1 Tax=Lipomyces starkeyi NRRL Y-11557 TaxID=675824 RepID=A0A1E3QCW6_LIPST|nr:hypothetical protein LIPSTDRAFT_962 [Lipomyces starkeyi NRRL Y-11557]